MTNRNSEWFLMAQDQAESIQLVVSPGTTQPPNALLNHNQADPSKPNHQTPYLLHFLVYM